MSINLLPDELKPKSSTLKASKKIRKFSIVMLTIFLILAFVVGGVVLVFSNLISVSKGKQDGFKAQISQLEQTETRLVLIKDRLTKINKLQKDDTVTLRLKVLKEVLSRVDGEIAFEEAVTDKNNISLKISFPNSQELGKFLATLNINEEIENLRMDGIKYQPEQGYEIALTI